MPTGRQDTRSEVERPERRQEEGFQSPVWQDCRRRGRPAQHLRGLMTKNSVDRALTETVLRQQYENGLAMERIAEKFGCSTGAVWRRLHRFGIAVRPNRLPRHGHHRVGHRTGTYLSWDTMTQRCLNPRNPNYPNYGGRGIGIHPSWRSFPMFLADMGERPPRGTLERINTDGNYEPSNCKWATRQEQLNNKRTNVVVEHDGKRMTLSQWAEFLGIPYMRLWHLHRRAQVWPPK